MEEQLREIIKEYITWGLTDEDFETVIKKILNLVNENK